MDEFSEREPCMKIYTPRPGKTPPTQNTMPRESDQVRIWNGSRQPNATVLD